MSSEEAAQSRSEAMREQKSLEEEQQMNVAAERVSQQIAAEEVSEIHKNPEFVDKLQDLGISSETFQWVGEELGVELAGAHIFGNRDQGYAERVDLLSDNTTAMVAAEATPGRILREHPDMLAVARGLHHRAGKDDNVLEMLQPPASPKEKRAIRASGELITNYKSKAEDGEGLNAVSTVTTERKQQTGEETTSTAEEASRSFFG